MSDWLTQAESELCALRVHEALTQFDRAERAQSDPDRCAAGRWQCHMLLGDFEKAWRESDLIHARAKPDPNRFWNGRPLDGKRVLIRCLHGLGDTIQFIRYAPLLRDVARSVIVEAQPKLKILLAQSELADDVITWSDPDPEWDQQVEIMELPRIFRTTLETIPRHVPYLHAPADDVLFAINSCTLRVGIAWTSSTFNTARTVPIAELALIFAIPGISLYGLQAGPEHIELAPWPCIRDLHDRVSTIEDTARVLKSLDLIISVDTMTAHLAGALALPVWTLLPYECDWRWMLHRDDSPWYPSMRLFRQPEPDNWGALINRLRHELILFGSSRNGEMKG